jgi:metal transporter CNNM
LVHALPIAAVAATESTVLNEEPMTPEEFYTNLIISICLVLAGGVFAGLTLGLMGQDEVYLKVMATSGDKHERKHATRVLELIGKGKHWVLVTLLLSNVITNETLPIVLDRCLGGGWPAVVTSTAAIVVFGEIIPQSISVRYGLQVGSLFAPFVLMLMYLMYPLAYPIALLLDYLLGEDHGTVYKKSGLKTLVTLHRTMGAERLNQDEVTIISAVLDLKEKPVSSIMTPMNRVYTMSADTILDEKTVEEIFNAGFSRIPIHLPNEPMNFIGMLLVRVLISYDPEDALPVASFPLATLPETGLDTSCLNILNYFQEGKSHMIVVSELPGEPTGAVGVLTLEDVIEELIGEEIVDESDVYVDINKNIKRKQPGPLSKRNLMSYLHHLYKSSASNSKRNSIDSNRETFQSLTLAQSPIPNLFTPASPPLGTVTEASAATKGWKPKNPAANPLETNKPFVTIKRQNPDTINSVLPGPNRNGPLGNKYSGIHVSEEGAIHEAQENTEQDNTPANVGSHPDLSSKNMYICEDYHESEVHSYNERHDKYVNGGIPIQSNNYSNGSKTELRESRSYRTGGIIESVVNVQGVHKIIIENVTDDEPIEDEVASFSDSKKKKKSKRKGKRTNSASEESTLSNDTEDHSLLSQGHS